MSLSNPRPIWTLGFFVASSSKNYLLERRFALRILIREVLI